MLLIAFGKASLPRCLPALIHRTGAPKMWIIMKLTAFLVVLATLHASASITAQTITLNEKNVPLEKVFKKITHQSGYVFFYEDDLLKKSGNITVVIDNGTIEQVLKLCFEHQFLEYSIVEKTVVIKEKNKQIEKPIYLIGALPPPIVGIILNENSQPLAGVNIAVKGTNQITSTDEAGRFEFNNLNDNAILVLSYVGYKTQEIGIKGRSTVTLRMEPDIKEGGQVVVLGYGTQTKRKITSAVATVSGEELNKRVATNPTVLLQGQLPGLQVTQGSAEPGAEGVQLLVRGITTYSGTGTSPLVIVDGIPGSLDVINPNDIESVTLLKDAASAAIYGFRGSNGVLVVKTKKGKSGDFSVQYVYNGSINTAAKLPKRITNSADYMTMLNEAFANSNMQPIYTQAQIDTYRNATDRIKYPNHDGLSDVFQTVYTQNHYLNISGGRENSNYTLGVGISDQPGIFIGNNYKKYTLNLGLSSRINKRISFGSNFQMRYGDKTNPPQGSGDEFLSASSQTPLYLPQLPDGRYTDKGYNLEGPNKNYVAIVKENIFARTRDYYLQGNLSLDVDIIDGLKWENRAGLNYGNNKFKSYRPANIPVYLYSTGAYSRNLDVGTPGLVATQSDNIYYTIYSQFTYRKSFGSHTVSAFAGAQEEDNQTSNISGSRLQFPTNYLQELDAGPVSGMANSGTSSEWAIRSLYGNVNYDFNDKYLFGGSIRRDGTSRLPEQSRFGTFYSVSGGWRISKENFFNTLSWLNDLKIRASYGVLGNQNIGTYPYQPVLASSIYVFGTATATGYQATQLVDPNLTWETTRIFDFGADLTAFNNKLTFSADYFNKYTFDILAAPLLPLYVGLNAPTVNIGAVRNKGLEFVAQYRDQIGKNFTYTVGGNIQGYKNKLEKFGTKSIGGNSVREEGHELDQYYLYIWDGIFQSQDEISKSPKQLTAVTPGDPKYKDVNGDGKVDPNDRTYVDGKYPLYTFSGNFGVSYQQFDFSLQVYGSARQKRYVNGTGIDPFNNTMPQVQWYNHWSPTNLTNELPKLYASNYQPVTGYASTYYLKDASFVRLKNVQFGYTMPVKLIQKVGIRSARLFFTGDNLLTFSKYPGLDPERTGDGGYLVYPQVKAFTFGASIRL